eukprot:5638497-Prymnesium_polylepis.1
MRQPVTVLLAEDAHSRVRVRGHSVRVMRVERRVEDGVRLGIHRRVENPVDQVFARCHHAARTHCLEAGARAG